MFREIAIKSYRGLKDINLEELSTVNIIVGENNTGKTSILEAIQLLKDQNVTTNIMSVVKKRHASAELIRRDSLTPFDEFLFAFSMYEEYEKYIGINALDEYENRYHLYVNGQLQQDIFYKEELPEAEQHRYQTYCGYDGELRFIEGNFSYKDRKMLCSEKYYFRETQFRPTVKKRLGKECINDKKDDKIVYISPLDIYSDRIMNASLYRGLRVEEKKQLIDLLQLFDERIVGIEVGVKYGRPIILIEVEGMGLMPVSIFGDGLKKILILASAMMKAENGILLIDEFETGIHQRALVQVADWLASAAEKRHIQIFLTSHSSDAVSALVQAQKKREIDISAYRLEHYMGDTYVKLFRSNELYDLIQIQGMDIL